MKQRDVISVPWNTFSKETKNGCCILSKLTKQDPACCSDLYIQGYLSSPAACNKNKWPFNPMYSLAHSNNTLTTADLLSNCVICFIEWSIDLRVLVNITRMKYHFYHILLDVRTYTHLSFKFSSWQAECWFAMCPQLQYYWLMTHQTAEGLWLWSVVPLFLWHSCHL